MIKKTTKQIVVISVLVSFLLSCSKNSTDNSNTTTNQKTILGEWKWIRSTGGWGDTRTPDNDSVVMLKLNTDSSYFVLLNNQVKYTGLFSSSIIPASNNLLVLQFDQTMDVHRLRIPKMQSVVYFNSDTCRLYDYPIADGYTHLYYRK